MLQESMASTASNTSINLPGSSDTPQIFVSCKKNLRQRYYHRLTDNDARSRTDKQYSYYVIISGLLTTSTFAATFSPYVTDTVEHVNQIGNAVDSNIQLYVWFRAACATSFLLSLMCIISSFAYLVLVGYKSANDYRRHYFHIPVGVFFMLEVVSAMIQFSLVGEFLMAFIAVLLGGLRFTGFALGITIIVIASIMVAITVVICISIKYLEKRMFKLGRSPSFLRQIDAAIAKSEHPQPMTCCSESEHFMAALGLSA